MLDAGVLAPYVGFTEEEVKELCEKYNRDFRGVERWYDGYLLSDLHIYNPRAVISVMDRGNFQSYWSQTGTFESISPYIDMDFDGLKTSIIEMIAGASIEVDTSFFQNDMVSFIDKEDVLTLLIHLGYLAYDQKKKTAYIPNEEIRQEFISATKKWNETVDTALKQIKEKKYPESLMQYSGNILLVGINYDKKTKVHQCAIEMMEF